MKISCLGAAVTLGAVLSVTSLPSIHAQTRSSVEQSAEAVLRARAQLLVQEALEGRAVRPIDPAITAADAARVAGALGHDRLELLVASGDATAVVDEWSRQASAAQLERVQAAALGSATSELLFVPVPPCRIIDTRLPGGLSGVLAAGEVRSFQVAGETEFGHQGGNPGGCDIPAGAAEPAAPAVVLNIVAVGPEGPGNLRAWPFGQPVPNAAVVNYAQVPGLNIANGVVLPIAGTSTVPADLNIRADVSGTHVVADVTGYFTRFPLPQFQSSVRELLVTSDGGAVSLADGACHLLNTCTVTSPTTGGRVYVRSWAQVAIDHTQGSETHDRMTIGPTFGNIGTPPSCADITNQVANMDFEVPDVGPTEADLDATGFFGRVFQQGPNVTRTYSLLGIMFVGASANDRVESTRMICTFIPD